MIQLTEVSKYYQERCAVDGITFTVEKGEVFGFLGPNGAGKTTTMRMMTGLLQSTSGEILINGMNISRHKKEIHAQIGVVFELPNLYMRSSIRNNLELFADLYRVAGNRVNEVMETLQLLDKEKAKVSNLSKGWKQRVLIARALLHKPQVLFLDEPTSGLDPNSASLIRNHVKRIQEEGTTIVLTTHDMHEAEALSDRVGIMHAGVLVAIDEPLRLKTIYGKPEIEVKYQQDGKVVMKSWPIAEEATKDHIYQLMSTNQILSMHSKEASLADVFAALTGSELS